MRKRIALLLVLLAGISFAVPALAFARGLFPGPEWVAPVALLAFGLLGMFGGVAGYIWPDRSENQPETPWKAEHSEEI
jgi:TRAP-type C4-dicarboxylate transport system permease small subunit